jgi:plastocyanin
MRKWAWVLAIMAMGAALLAAACGGDSEETAPKATAAISQQSQTAAVTASDFKFTPASLQATAGQKLTVTLKNAGAATHTFTIDELNIDQTLAPGAQVTVDVTPTRDGGLRFYCRFHAASSGMEGKITAGVAPSTSSSAQNQATKTASAGGYMGY